MTLPLYGRIMANILLIEDDVNLANIFAKWLEMDGHTVELAEHGEAGFNKIVHEDWTPDLVVSDVMMPNWDGGDFAFFLGSIAPEIPILIVTACSDTKKLQKIKQENGVREIIHKPITRRQLQENVGTILSELSP